MEEGCDSIALEMDIAPWGGQEFWVPTSFGHISVTVCGDQDKPALVTYPDVGLNSFSCFEGLLSCPDASSVLFHNFCFFHIQPPGHEIGAPDLAPEQATLSVDDLADQVAEVLEYFRLDEVIGLGVSGGAYILSLFACKYTDRALGLILVSPLARSPSWTEWLHNQALMNLLYFCGMTGFVKEMLLQRYFSLEVRDAAASVGETEVLTTIRQSMDERRSRNVMHYLQAIHQRRDLTENLKKLKCRTLILVGDQSPFHRDALHVSDAMNRRYNALIEVEGGGSLVTEERPQAMLVPIELFLTGYAFYQRPVVSLSSSPKSPLSPLCMAAELLSPESLGLKLKPIKTRVASQRSMEVVDVVQKCVNLMESIYWSQLQTRAYRTHCHDITLVVCKLWPTLVEALQRRNPNLCEVPGAEEVFDALKAELENALAVVNKCCAMRQFDKLIDQGQTKRFLTMSRENLFMRSKEAYQYTMRVCPPKFRKKSPDSLQGRPESTPSSIASGEKSVYFAD